MQSSNPPLYRYPSGTYSVQPLRLKRPPSLRNSRVQREQGQQYDLSQYDRSQYDRPQYDQPHYRPSQYGQPQYVQPQYSLPPPPSIAPLRPRSSRSRLSPLAEQVGLEENDADSDVAYTPTFMKPRDPPPAILRSSTSSTRTTSLSTASGSTSTTPEKPRQRAPLPASDSRQSIIQTRYMQMLLSLDKIPRAHNILAALFSWMLLAGFVMFPGTFISPSETGDISNSQTQSVTFDDGVVNTVQNTFLLSVAGSCCTIGVMGLVWLAVRWRKNYVWLLNRVYLPGLLNGLAGILATLTMVYSHHNGNWNISAKIAGVLEGTCLVLCSFSFIFINNLLLKRLKQQHLRALHSERGDRGLIGRVGKAARGQPFAPGSIV